MSRFSIPRFTEDDMKRLNSFALAAAILAPPCAHGTAFTCVALDYPPLIYKTGNGQPAGLAFDIVTRALQQLGHTVNVEIYPWSRALAMVQSGEADCIFTIYRTPERERFLEFSNESLVSQPIYLYAHKGREIHFDGDFDPIKGFRIGTAYKINYGPKFEQARSSLNIDEAPTIEQNFKKLAMGRVDLVPSYAHAAAFTLSSPALQGYADKIVRLPMPVDSVPSHIAFSRLMNLTALRDGIDAELRKISASGEYRQLLDNYRLDRAPDLAGLSEKKH
jgi:polar amino acid transport system substrate-binding protein